MRIAMWSGPRNLSTAMMYSFGARPDFAVVDEPFYATYLAATGLDHPMRAEILASQSADPGGVITQLLESIPGEKPHFYQKHMTQHIVFPDYSDWMNSLTNIFLIRHPARVIASYAAKRENPTLDDIGFEQQVRLFEEIRDQGGDPVVIDSHDIREDPENMLKRLCEAININWDPAMLHWPAGGHPDDGVWASHWYGSAHRSTGFAGPEGALPNLDGLNSDLCAQTMPIYEKLRALKI